MFLEPSIKKGWIEVICGSMFSGKTEELIRRIKRATIAKQRIKIFKSAIDTRYDEQKIVSHNATTILSIPINTASEILQHIDNVEVIAIDEAQFFSKELYKTCEIVAQKGIRVIVAGLDMDYKGHPFGPMPYLLAVAEYITKLRAICVQCGQPASHSYRKVSDNNRLMLGSMSQYEPRCRSCYHLETIVEKSVNKLPKYSKAE